MPGVLYNVLWSPPLTDTQSRNDNNSSYSGYAGEPAHVPQTGWQTVAGTNGEAIPVILEDHREIPEIDINESEIPFNQGNV